VAVTERDAKGAEAEPAPLRATVCAILGVLAAMLILGIAMAHT
jgi:hypothetical protein